MAFLNNNVEATLVNIKMTEKGRELLTKGLKEDDNFDIVKYSFGDSEINYTLDAASGTSIQEPAAKEVDLVYKLYASGTVPSGTPTMTLSTDEVNMSTYQTGVMGSQGVVHATTYWAPVEGTYQEEYKWTNLGPLNDWDFQVLQTYDTKSATIRTFGTTGTTTVKVKGMISGLHKTFVLNIS